MSQEAFSTCQRYIQRRTITGIHDHPSDPVLRTSGPEPELSPDLVEFVTSADTMLIATAHPQKGADSSHRGGRPGFVRVIDNRKLVWGVRLSLYKYTCWQMKRVS